MRHISTLSLFLAGASAVALLGCGGGGDGASEAGTADSADTAYAASAAPDDTVCRRLAGVPADSMETTSSGLGVLQVTEGQGPAAATGDTVEAHYVGCLTDETEFDASHDRGRPIRVELGAGQVIPGWEEGLRGMRPGGVRVLRIPPELGYGARGTPGGPIPPDATLLFRVEVVEVRPGG